MAMSDIDGDQILDLVAGSGFAPYVASADGQSIGNVRIYFLDSSGYSTREVDIGSSALGANVLANFDRFFPHIIIHSNPVCMFFEVRVLCCIF